MSVTWQGLFTWMNSGQQSTNWMPKIREWNGNML